MVKGPRKIVIVENISQIPASVESVKEGDFCEIIALCPKSLFPKGVERIISYEDDYIDSHQLYNLQHKVGLFVEKLLKDISSSIKVSYEGGVDLFNCVYRDFYYLIFTQIRNRLLFDSILKHGGIEQGIIFKSNNPYDVMVNAHLEIFFREKGIPYLYVNIPSRTETTNKNYKYLTQLLVNRLSRMSLVKGKRMLFSMKDTLVFMNSRNHGDIVPFVLSSCVNYKKSLEYIKRGIRIIGVPEPSNDFSSIISESADIANECIFEGMKLSLGLDYIKNFFKRNLKKARHLIKYYLEVLDKYGFEKIVVDEDVTLLNKTLVLAAKERGIETVVAQHGSFIREDLYPGYLPFSSDKFCVIDKLSAGQIAGMIPSEKVELKEHNYFCEINRNKWASLHEFYKKYKVNPDKYILLINPSNKWEGQRGVPIRHMTPDKYDKFVDIVKSIAFELKGVDFVVKLRPGDEKNRFYEEMFKCSDGLQNIKIIEGTPEDTWELIMRSKYLIFLCWTTAMVEAIELQKPVVFYDFQDAYGKFQKLFKCENFEYFNCYHNLIKSLLAKHESY